MFERRLKVLLSVLSTAGLIVIGRLAHLQVVRADYYRRRAEQSMFLKPKPLPFVRGSILDRTGGILVSDEPGWDLKVDYRVLAAEVSDEPETLKRAVRRWRRFYKKHGAITDEEIAQEFRADVASMWVDIADGFGASGEPGAVDAWRDRAWEIYDRVQGIRRAVAGRRGFDSPVREETVAHAVVSGLGPEAQITAREAFARYPWVYVAPSAVRRHAGDGTPFAHVLGRMGRVDAATVAGDANADDPFARYLADEGVGLTGVEYAAEQLLRGRRGQIAKDRKGNVIEDIAAEDGRDVTVTLHAGLQRRLYELLAETVHRVPESSGGAMVVLEVPRREVLALVSYPSYDPERFDEVYPLLRTNTESLPLRFRAVANQYAPGSTVKPLACLAGLVSGKITLDTRLECRGYLFPEHRDRWRCWQIHGTSLRKAHGMIDVVEALTGSCNVFMYQVGEMAGVDTLCGVFDMVGFGRTTGIGLREEATGINPTPSWLMTERNSPVYPAHARLFSIGQGELLVTPLQLANLMATYASGRFRPVTLVRTGETTPEWTLPGTPAQWAAIHRGIYGVVNDPEGTAYKYAHFTNDHYALCGKTGSATAYPWTTSYRVPYVDRDGVEQEAIVPAGFKRQAIELFEAEYPAVEFDPSAVTVASRWPPDPPLDGERHSHAWFGGYLQPLETSGQPDWSREPRIAFAVLVEFGGSGGRTSGPLAKRVAAELVDLFGPDLNVDPADAGEKDR